MFLKRRRNKYRALSGNVVVLFWEPSQYSDKLLSVRWWLLSCGTFKVGQHVTGPCTKLAFLGKSESLVGTYRLDLQMWLFSLRRSQGLVISLWPEDTQQKFTRRGSTPRSNPLPFYIAFFARKGTPFVYLLRTNVTPITHLP